MKVALIHDHLAQNGGAEKVAKTLQKLFPDSPTYVLVHDKTKTDPEFSDRDIRTSFLQSFPGGVRNYEWLLMLMPSATEHYDLNEYDLVISSTSFSAKGVITRPGATHICYCHTPTRFLWTDSHQYLNELKYNYFIKKTLPFILPRLRLWDRLAAERVDHFIANSNEVKKRIAKYYHREATVIHPPVKVTAFSLSDKKGDFFLAGGRLVGYKRFDLIVDAFNRLNLPLKIFGDGPLALKLRRLAKSNIEFLGRVTEADKADLMSRARAFIHPQIEDFGITAVEAMAAGTPVIAFRDGGALETVVDGVTGIFFPEQTWESLADKIIRFRPENFQPEEIRKHAFNFDEKIFETKFGNYLEKTLATKQSRLF